MLAVRRLSRFPLALGLLVLAAAPAPAQDGPATPTLAEIGTWEVFASFYRVQALTAGDGALWAGTDGGVFRYDPETEDFERYTTGNGLTDADARALAFDEARGVLWIGYDDGTLDRLDAASGAVVGFPDIARADRFTQRGITRLRLDGDSLLVGTDFGLVVFDAAEGAVLDTYEKFGGLPSGLAVYDALLAPVPEGGAGLWLATEGGVVRARRAAPNLREPSAWTVEEDAPEPARSLAFFSGGVFAGRAAVDDEAGDLFRRRPDGTWERLSFSDRTVSDLFVAEGRLFAVSPFRIGTYDADLTRGRLFVSGASGLLAAVPGLEGRVWAGTEERGLSLLPAPPQSGDEEGMAERFVVPDGPLTNRVTALDVGPDGTLWVGYARVSAEVNGMSRFDGRTWTSFARRDGVDVAGSPIRAVLAYSEGGAWGGSEGDGLMRVTPDGEVVTYRSGNSTLTGDPGFPDFIVVLGVDEDDAGRVWATNREGARRLHVWSEEEGWAGVGRPPGLPIGAGRYADVYVGSFGTKWISLLNSRQRVGAGFLALDTRSTPRDDSDDEGVAVTEVGSSTTGEGLPDQTVNAFAEDLEGRLWIGTDRGLAVIFSPGSVFADPALARPTWARIPDQTDFLLRDLTIFDIAVDPAGRKWLASNTGAWLLNAEGNEVVAQFTEGNSPLPDDVVVDVAVDPTSGRVYFATDAGVVSYQGSSVAPSADLRDLRVFPNPFRPAVHAGVQVEGLVAETDVRVLTVDGQVVAAFDVRGGSAAWDGRDQRTGELVPSGVYLVAASGQDGEGTAYGKVAVIR